MIYKVASETKKKKKSLKNLTEVNSQCGYFFTLDCVYMFGNEYKQGISPKNIAISTHTNNS